MLAQMVCCWTEQARLSFALHYVRTGLVLISAGKGQFWYSLFFQRCARGLWFVRVTVSCPWLAFSFLRLAHDLASAATFRTLSLCWGHVPCRLIMCLLLSYYWFIASVSLHLVPPLYQAVLQVSLLGVDLSEATYSMSKTKYGTLPAYSSVPLVSGNGVWDATMLVARSASFCNQWATIVNWWHSRGFWIRR